MSFNLIKTTSNFCRNLKSGRIKMGLLTVLKKLKQKEKEMRILML